MRTVKIVLFCSLTLAAFGASASAITSHQVSSVLNANWESLVDEGELDLGPALLAFTQVGHQYPECTVLSEGVDGSVTQNCVTVTDLTLLLKTEKPGEGMTTVRKANQILDIQVLAKFEKGALRLKVLRALLGNS